jgi:hypothetical protein
MIHIKIKIGDNSTKILKNDMWKSEKSNCIFFKKLLKRYNINLNEKIKLTF